MPRWAKVPVEGCVLQNMRQVEEMRTVSGIKGERRPRGGRNVKVKKMSKHYYVARNGPKNTKKNKH